jgi:hypothetical protein
VTLDPIESVYSKDFVTVQKSPGNGETRVARIWNDEQTYGLRGNEDMGKGAFLGQEVTGVRELSQVIASSKEFSVCVVKTAFEHLFGRKPVSTDVGFVQRLSDRFMGPLTYNYNKLIEELAASPEFRRED